ncbi:MAG: pre-peptidase C-terminal domain-containing protein, partial [Anaerolineae bacterium]|nr:pre-peptidase C-terminal domain-containing protein [Anaerolineae bacterium]
MMNKRLKQLNIVLIVVLFLGNPLSGLSAGLPRTVSAYDPPPTATVAPSSPSSAPTTDLPAAKSTPVPSALSPEAEKARVKEVAQAVLDKYATYYGPRYQTTVNEVVVKDEWAYVVTAPSNNLSEPLYILAHRDLNGIWQAQTPGIEGPYLQWLAEVPATLLSATEKDNLHHAAEKLADWRQVILSPPTPRPAVASIPVSEPTPTPTPIIVQSGYDSPERAIEAAVEQYRQSDSIITESFSIPVQFLTDEDGETTSLFTTPTPSSQSSTWVAGKTSVSQLSKEERAKLCGVSEEVAEWERLQTNQEPARHDIVYSYPSAKDWRSTNGQDWTTPIRYQGSCGSCVAFGTIGAIESRIEIANSDAASNPDLSESHLFFCGGGTCGQGWYPEAAMNFARDVGIVDEACDPYTPDDQTCNPCSDWQNRVTKIGSWNGANNVSEMKQSLADYGPFEVTMAVYDDFFSYSGGIYRHIWGDLSGYHAVAVVGYDDSGGYWIAKNSWGTGWGENGWFKIAYGECDIDNYAYIPVVSVSPPSPPPSGDWQISYFNNPDLTAPQCHQEGFNGAYVFKDWGDDAPGGSCGQDNFSARARRTLHFDEGDYTFYLFADDHARLLVGNDLVVNQWPPATAHIESRHLSAGDYEVVVEYRDTGGRGVLGAWWTGPSFPAMPQDQQAPSQWYGEYWANRHWWENPVFKRNEGISLPFSHDWGYSGPGYGLPEDRFATRFTRTAYFECGRYRFEFNADDYAELSVDPVSPLLSFSGNGYQLQEVDIPAGNHTVRVNHKEESGAASLYVNWTLLTPCEPPTATPTATPTSTPEPTATSTPLPTPTATAQPTATPTPTNTPTPSPTPTGVPTCTDPHEPNNAAGQATTISYEQVINDAQICPAGDVDYYVFTGFAGDRVVVNIDARVNGSPLDSYLYLLDTDGSTILAYNDDYDGVDSYLEYTLPYDGNFYLRVRDYYDNGGPDYFYSLSLFPLLTVDQASITDGTGNPQNTFYPGDTIGLWATASNHASQVISTTWGWYVYGPAWQWIPALSLTGWEYDLLPGTESWGIVRTLQSTSPGGEYTFYGWVESGSYYDYRSNTFAVIAPPDLAPYQNWDWEYPVVPSSVTDTHSVNTLYVDLTTYLDWGVRNMSGLDIADTFYVDLYLDDARFVHYPFDGISAGSRNYFLDWAEGFSKGGWHTLKIVIDPENTVAESDETNNTWEQSFYWEYNCVDPWEPNDTPDTATVLTYGQVIGNVDICPPGDVDYYVFSGNPNDIVEADVDAWINGSSLDSYLYLLDSDGVTPLTFNDDWGNLDSYIHHMLTQTGAFYLKVREFNDPYEGGSAYFYTLALSGTLAMTAPFADDMENSINGWTATGLWHPVDATSPYSSSFSPTHSWWYGQDDTGTYDTGTTNAGSLTSPPIYIPDVGYYLRFWYAYQTESQSTAFDWRLVQISADGGPFVTVLQLYDDPMGPWLQSPAIDLSAYAGQVIQMRFYFDTLDELYNAYRGWYIDDVDISATPPPTCYDAYEPNNIYAQATALAYDDSLSADICPNGDYDFYRFTGAIGDKVVVDIDASVYGSALDSYIYLLDSDGSTVLTLSDDDYVSPDSRLGYELPHDGDYYIKVKAWNHPSVGSPDHFYVLTLLTDDTDPIAEMEAPLNGSYLSAITAITVTATDDQSVQHVEFLYHDGDWVNSEWQWLGADWDGSDGWSLNWDTSVITDQSDIAIYIWAFDWVGHWDSVASWSLTLDRTPPDTAMDITPPYGDAPFRDFWVSWWNSQDNLSGIASYVVQYRDGAGGAWTELLLDTTEVYTRFVGTDDHTYYFRVRACDLAGNQSSYTEGDGDAQYTVDICDIAPDVYEIDDDAANATELLFTNGYTQTHNIHSESNPDWIKFYAVAGFTYTLSTTNTGGHADTVLYLYNTDGSTLIMYNDDYPGMRYASYVTWQPDVSGVYYARVKHWDPWAYGCTTAYGLSVASNDTTAPTGSVV